MDRQKDALYAWESTFRSFDERTLTREETREVIRCCCRRYGLKPPRVRFMPEHKSEMSFLLGKVITMNYYHCNHAVACHEAAHYILASLDHDEEAEDHGPEFVCLYLDLLIEERVAPRSALEASLEQAGIEWTKSAARK